MVFFLSALISFALTFILMPVIIKVARSIDLMDAPDSRKLHSVDSPSMGGIGIFIGFIIAAAISIKLSELAELKYFLSGLLIIFILGLRDDISSLQAKHKISVQVISSILVTYFSKISLTGFYGIGGIEEVHPSMAILMSIFMLVILTNSFNLIDGIDGLAGGLGVLVLSVYAWIFIEIGFIGYSIVCLSVVGALVAFLFFNWHPSKVFMGDTGSMLLGFMIAALSIVVINHAQDLNLGFGMTITSPIPVVFGVLILPIYDTLRVISIRISTGNNPLAPDRNHIHHALLRLGINHSKASTILIALNFLMIAAAILFNDNIAPFWLVFAEFVTIVALGLAVDFVGKKLEEAREERKVRLSDPFYISKSA